MVTKNIAASAAEDTTLHADQLRELKYAESILDGEQPHLQSLYYHYIYNLLQHTKRTSATAYMIASFLENTMKGDISSGKVKFPAAAGAKGSFYASKDAGKKQVSEADWETLTTHFEQFKTPVTIPDEDSVFKNLLRLTDILDLNEGEKKPLGFLYVANKHAELGLFLTTVFEDDVRKAAVGIARMLDAPLDGRKYFAAMGYGARLNRYGLVYFENGGPSSEAGLPRIDEEILEKFEMTLSDDEIAGVLLGKPMVSKLDVADFSHVGEQLDFILNLIEKSVASGEKGINILLHGPAGSGKTELAGALAKHLGLRLFSIGEPDQEDMEDYNEYGSKRPANEVRVTKLLRTQALLDGSKNSLVLFDEIEDLLMKGTDSSKSADTENKLQVNRLLETNPVVTIWTGNNPEKFHDAVRQRFTYSVLMDYPPTLVREKVWRRRLEMENVTLSPEDVRTLARDYAAPARMIAKAVRTMRIIGGGIDTIHASLEADSKLVAGQTDAIFIDDGIPKNFSIDYLNGDKSLHEMFNRLVARGVEKKPFSLLLKADPQTGAEHYLRSMAEEMVMNPYEVSFADLCAPHPMMPPEQKFRSVFEGSADSRQFLIIHGLEDLAGGEEVLDWKNGLVDLFSHYALKHKLPFAIMAKPKTALPQGIGMLFSDQVTMAPMTGDQVKALYQKTFDQALPEDRAQQLKGLSMEDFFKAKSFLTRLDAGGDQFDHNRAIGLLQRFKERRQSQESDGIGFMSKTI